MSRKLKRIPPQRIHVRSKLIKSFIWGAKSGRLRWPIGVERWTGRCGELGCPVSSQTQIHCNRIAIMANICNDSNVSLIIDTFHSMKWVKHLNHCKYLPCWHFDCDRFTLRLLLHKTKQTTDILPICATNWVDFFFN